MNSGSLYLGNRVTSVIAPWLSGCTFGRESVEIAPYCTVLYVYKLTEVELRSFTVVYNSESYIKSAA